MADMQEMSGGIAQDDMRIAGDLVRYRNFLALQDLPPQKTLFIEVMGEVLVGNPGIDVDMTYAEPQGIVAEILLLRVTPIQRPGLWPQVMTWKPVRYFAMIVGPGQYSQVQFDAPFDIPTIEVADRG